MPPRYAYWTILAGGLPTAFRAAEREELLPTFNRLRERHPDAELKYFARGRLWASREDAMRAREARAERSARGRDWRPGGEHRDPRQRFNDERKAKNQARRQERWEHKNRPPAPKDAPNPAGRPKRPFERNDGRRQEHARGRNERDRVPGPAHSRPGPGRDRSFGRPSERPPGKPARKPPTHAHSKPYGKPPESRKPYGKPPESPRGRPPRPPQGRGGRGRR